MGSSPTVGTARAGSCALPSDSVSTSAEIVIIGGGVIGASIAYHLAARGTRDVVVLERDALGAGSTSRNAGGIRLQFSSEINVRLSQRSLPRFRSFEAELGIDPAFHQVGYPFLVTTDRAAIAFTRPLALWDPLGVPARRLDGRGAGALPAVPHGRRPLRHVLPRTATRPSSVLQPGVERAGGSASRSARARRQVETAGGRDGGPRRRRADRLRPRRSSRQAARGPAYARLAGVEAADPPLRRHIFVTDVVPASTATSR